MTSADLILKYRKLYEEGVITLEEYEKKKHQLLTELDQAEKVRAKTGSTISAYATSILAYFSWIGFLIAVILGDRQGASFHLNQALVIKIAGVLTFVPVLGWLWGIFIFVCWIIGLVSAISGNENKVPLIGDIKII